MKKRYQLIQGAIFLALFLMMAAPASAAPACKGPNKNDPGCPGAETPVDQIDPAIVESVTVDWFNQTLVVRGSGLSGVSSFTLGGNATALGTANVTDTELNIPFSADMAAEVVTQGNYNLAADAVVMLSVYFEGQIIDPAATGCPCEADWTSQLGVLWTVKESECLELEGPGVNDPADISGTILSVSGDATAYPQYPIGASFYPGEPLNSVCRLVEVAGDATFMDLVNQQINENQQFDCAAALKANVCASVTQIP